MSEQTATDEQPIDPRPAVWQQLAALYRGLSHGQRVSVGLAAVLLGAGFTWVTMNRSNAAVIPLLNGRELSGAELASARKQLADAGLNGFQVVHGRILAPATDAARYDAVLSARDSDAAGWAGAWQEANASLSPFATGRQQHDAQEIARARLIGQLLAQLPDVAQAEIVWDEEPRIGWRQPAKVRATVYLQPRERREITLDIVAAVKQAVAGSKAHLDPDDIVVLDLQRMVAYGSGTGSDGTTGDQQRLAVLTSAYRQRIEDALADIEGVRVAVVVEPVSVGVPSASSSVPVQRDSQAARSTSLRSPVSPAPRLNTSSGGPNLRLEVPRFLAEPAPVIESGSSSTATIAANPDIRPAALEPALSDSVRVTIALAPEYIRRQAEQRHTKAEFARLSPARQQALLADMARAIGRNVRERAANMIPGATLDDRLAQVRVVSELTSVGTAGVAEAEAPMQPAGLSSTGSTVPTARAVILGIILCLVVWMLYQAARALRRRWREVPLRSRVDRQSHPAAAMADADGPTSVTTAVAPESVAARVADLIARMDREDADVWTRDIAGESPRVVAAVLRRLPPERVTDVLAALSVDIQSTVLAELAGLHEAPAKPVVEPVHRKAPVPYADRRKPTAAPRRRGWFQRWRPGNPAAGRADWYETEPMPYEEVSDLDQITELDPAALRSRYVELPVETWSTALMGASSAFRVRLLSALPAGDAAALRQALTRHRPARLDDIESAQSQVLALLNGHAIAAIEAR